MDMLTSYGHIDRLISQNKNTDFFLLLACCVALNNSLSESEQIIDPTPDAGRFTRNMMQYIMYIRLSTGEIY